MALVHFAEQAVDVALMEVGMGGRLDATNVITPAVSVITKIGMDHEMCLGDTVEKIAREKAGIMKPGVPVLTMKQDKGVEEVLREEAERAGTSVEVLGGEIEFSQRFESAPKLGPHMRIGVTSGSGSFEHVAVPLQGEHQAPNCGLALAVLGKLIGMGLPMNELDVVDGLAETRVPGRMEIIGRRPRVLLDGAHNPEALGALVKAIGAHVPYDSMVVIFGCAGDKPVDGLLEQVEKIGDKVIFTRAKGNPRAADPSELAEKFRARSHKMWQIADTLDEALAIARRATGRDDLVCVTGSFYLVGEARKLLVSEEPASLAGAGAPA
jgi:dihydrofolate synthase/folylpolyglutamate synthase